MRGLSTYVIVKMLVCCILIMFFSLIQIHWLFTIASFATDGWRQLLQSNQREAYQLSSISKLLDVVFTNTRNTILPSILSSNFGTHVRQLACYLFLVSINKKVFSVYNPGQALLIIQIIMFQKLLTIQFTKFRTCFDCFRTQNLNLLFVVYDL